MSSHQLSDIYQTLFEEAVNKVGAKLFTVMILDREEGTAKREFTSHPVEYPASGSKPMRDDRWSNVVIDNKQVFVANTTAGFSDVFSDHPLINELGCEAVVNIPVLENDIVVGTVNFLHEENYFTEDRVKALEALVLNNTPALQKAFKASLLTN
jgi:hypothetical protein